MKLAKWDDGFVLDTDPRREDPLYYYMREGAWGSSIGIEVAPLYKEHDVTDVCIRVWPDHLPREARMATAERSQMYQRVISTLLIRFSAKWSRVTLQSPEFPDVLDDNLVSAAFAEAGFFTSTNTVLNERTWRKVSKSQS